MKFYVKAILLILFLCMITSSVHAYEAWYELESINCGQFVGKEKEKYVPIYLPDRGGVIHSTNSKQFLAQDNNNIIIGFREEQVHKIAYNRTGAKAIYYLLKNKRTPYKYRDIKMSYTKYNRTDILLGYTLSNPRWNLKLGYINILGENIFKVRMDGGIIEGSDTALFNNRYRSFYTMWEGQEKDRGIGHGYYLDLKYQVNDQFTLHLTGDDLFTKITWDGLDKYDGTVDSQIIKQDSNGRDYFDPPLKGDYYINDGILTIYPSPLLLTKLKYRSNKYKITNWIQYHNTLQLGLEGAYTIGEESYLSAGLGYQTNNFFYKLGFKSSYLNLDIQFSPLFGRKSDIELGLQFHLF